MSASEIIEIWRNISLVLLAAFGLLFALRQLQRARKKDSYDLFIKASEHMASENPELRERGEKLMKTLQNDPNIEQLVFESYKDYIESQNPDNDEGSRIDD